MKQLAVFGHPVAHSRSPEIHAAFGVQAGIELSYIRVEAPLDGFEASARKFLGGGGLGFNVTVPFKRDAFDLVDECEDSARQSEAVNTVLAKDGKLFGANTDGVGLVRDIEANLGWDPGGQKILIIGAGGAAAGVLPALLARRPSQIDVMNRTHARAVELAERFGIGAVHADKAQTYDLVISASAGGLGEQPTALPEAIIGPSTRCYDMIYGAGVTPFCRFSQQAGADAVSDGLGMLVEQAAAAFYIWFDFEPDTAPVIAQVRNSLGDSL